jgi:hypothetical protein
MHQAKAQLVDDKKTQQATDTAGQTGRSHKTKNVARKQGQ